MYIINAVKVPPVLEGMADDINYHLISFEENYVKTGTHAPTHCAVNVLEHTTALRV